MLPSRFPNLLVNGSAGIAVGMATIFGSAFGSHLTALWYHFAILFEALFILTTIDAGTRVGRFMIQELGAHLWKPLGRTSWYPATIIASALAVAGWGWFLIQGVLDPLGGINSLWPLFGISNQLLAAVALSVGTTMIIKSGKARYAWITLVPLAWVCTVTFTAGWLKIFATDPRLGLLAQAAAATNTRIIFNARLDAALCALFLTITALVVLSAAKEWIGLLRGTVPMRTTETPFVETRYAD